MILQQYVKQEIKNLTTKCRDSGQRKEPSIFQEHLCSSNMKPQWKWIDDNKDQPCDHQTNKIACTKESLRELLALCSICFRYLRLLKKPTP